MIRLSLARVIVFGLVLTVAAVGVSSAIDDSKGGGQEQAVHEKGKKRGPRGKRGPKGETGPKGEVGPPGAAGAAGTDQAIDFSVNWRNGQFAGRDTAAVAIPGIGTLTMTCNLAEQQLSLAPASGAVRTVMTLTSFQGAGTTAAANDRFVSDAGETVSISPPDFPINGMLAGTLSVEPKTGDGGPGPAPATLNLSSYLKINDPDPAQNFCFIAGQLLVRGS